VPEPGFPVEDWVRNQRAARERYRRAVGRGRRVADWEIPPYRPPGTDAASDPTMEGQPPPRTYRPGLDAPGGQFENVDRDAELEYIDGMIDRGYDYDPWERAFYDPKTGEKVGDLPGFYART
jgi:hypothetical protein